MADYFGAASDLFSGLGDFFGGQAEAAGSKKAASLYSQAAKYAQTGGEIKDLMLKRQAFQTIGGTQADIGAAGLKMSGSAAEVMRSNAQQASLARGINDINTRIQVNSYQAQAAAAKAAASAQSSGGIFSALGSIVSAAALL